MKHMEFKEVECDTSITTYPGKVVGIKGITTCMYGTKIKRQLLW